MRARFNLLEPEGLPQVVVGRCVLLERPGAQAGSLDALRLFLDKLGARFGCKGQRTPPTDLMIVILICFNICLLDVLYFIY